MINIETIKVSIANSDHITNTYLVYDETKEAILIDPGDEEEKILERIRTLQLDIKYIGITHAHADHIGAVERIVNETNAKVLVHENDYLALLSEKENYREMMNVKKQYIDENRIIKVNDNYTFKVGSLKFEVLHTPGHTSGCICLFESTSNILFTGDTIFADCYGRCDLETGDFTKMVISIRKLFNRFTDVIIYPGHDEIVNIDKAKRKIRMLVAMKGEKI